MAACIVSFVDLDGIRHSWRCRSTHLIADRLTASWYRIRFAQLVRIRLRGRGLMRSLLAIAVFLLVCAGSSTNVLAQRNPQLADAKKMIDSHFAQLMRFSRQNAETETLNKSLEKMANSEVAIWDKLSEPNRRAAKRYADRKIKSSTSVRRYLISKVQPSKSRPANLATRAAAGGPCQIIGFIVCYRTCCANGAGNGVAACVGGVTCQNCWSESCPP